MGRTELIVNCLIDKFWSYITFVVIDSGPPSNLMLTQVNGRRVQASWTAPSNPVVDYRVFIDGANVNGNGNIVASGTTYNTTSQFGADTIVTIRVRATATYWSEVVMASITVHGKYLLQLCTSTYLKQLAYHHHSDVCNFFASPVDNCYI